MAADDVEVPDEDNAEAQDDDLSPDLSLSLRPPRRAFVLAYVGVVLSGLLGAAIGGGLVDSMCHGSCGTNVAFGALIGGVTAAAGVAVVAVLVLRAMHEWNRYQARPLEAQTQEAQTQENDSRRNPSA